MRASRHGFMLADAAIGLAILASLTLMLSISVGYHRRSSQRLADSREACRLAEETLLALRVGRPVPPSSDDVQVRIRYEDSERTPPGQAWAEVTVTWHGRSAALTGLVQSQAAAAVERGALP